jgi:hypothetical protein
MPHSGRSSPAGGHDMGGASEYQTGVEGLVAAADSTTHGALLDILG